MAKPKTPDNLKRVLLVGRVYPRTLEFLDALGEPNYGRAVDRLVDMQRSIMRAMKPELRIEVEGLPPLPRKTA